MNLPDKCVVDTNVPVKANLANQPGREPDFPRDCVHQCVEAIKHVMQNRALVIDAGKEIFAEYKRHLSLSGQPGVGDGFMKWVCIHCLSSLDSHRVTITKTGDTYAEFPKHKGLTGFDPDDHKFVAVANAHPDKPPILQATDAEWWDYQDVLREAGIEVRLLCPDYVKAKHEARQRR